MSSFLRSFVRWLLAGAALLAIVFTTVSVQRGTRTPESPLALPPLVIGDGGDRQVIHVDIASPDSIQTVRSLPVTADGSIIAWVQDNQRRLTPPFLMILAERLYGYDREAAAVWYHTGLIRGRYDASRCTDRSADPALEMLVALAPDIARYLRAHPVQWATAAEQAIDSTFAETELSSPWWICKHALAALRAGVRGEIPSDWMRPEEDWPELRALALADYGDDVRDVVVANPVTGATEGDSERLAPSEDVTDDQSTN
ncbi:MAG: hypothetical protein CMM50_00940 [Rhodospirillaceae bacterium]|jgi:hypothetical protein|nr:hypothetical protein [Rhodospirillaceae bacterium]